MRPRRSPARGAAAAFRAALLALALALSGCGGGEGSAPKEDPTFFTVRAVIKQLPPPCAMPAMVQLRAGQPVACFELGPPGVDAGDVSSAKVVKGPAPDNQSVEFDLSRTGADRFNALARTVGIDGQIAVVVDGEVVSVPHLASTDFSGKGLVAGLDPEAARQLATRLERA